MLRRTTIPYDRLRLHADDFQNPRRRHGLDEDSLIELAAAITIHGLLSPLLVRADAVILGGQRRYLAIGILRERPAVVAAYLDALELPDALERAQFRANDLDDVPVVIVDEAAAELSLVDNLQREPLSSYEIAEAVCALSADRSAAAVGRQIGKSKSWVSRILKAYKGAGPALREAWRSEQIAYERVKDLADLPPARQVDAVTAELSGDRVRGTYGRPSITAVRSLLDELGQMPMEAERLQRLIAEPVETDEVTAFELGARTALQYVAGTLPENTLRYAMGMKTLDSAAK